MSHTDNKVFYMRIQANTAAFDPDPIPEVIALLQKTIQELQNGNTSYTLRDTNGNKTGYYYFERA